MSKITNYGLSSAFIAVTIMAMQQWASKCFNHHWSHLLQSTLSSFFGFVKSLQRNPATAKFQGKKESF